MVIKVPKQIKYLHIDMSVLSDKNIPVKEYVNILKLTLKKYGTLKLLLSYIYKTGSLGVKKV